MTDRAIPTRLSVDDGTYKAFMAGELRNLVIRVDGKLQHRVLAFDKAAGTVERFKRDGKGRVIHSGGVAETETIKGKVTVTWSGPA